MRMRRREDDNIYPLRGWKALLHKTIMLLLFPLRKPLIFFPVLFILFMAPTFRGVKPAEVHLWYWSKIKQYTSVVTGFVSEKTKDVLPKDFKITMPSLTEKKCQAEKGTDKLVDFPSVDVNANRRAIFERASGAPRPVDIVEVPDYAEEIPVDSDLPAENTDAAADDSEIPAIAEESVREEVPQPVKRKVKRNLPLIYLDEPKEVIGVTKVYNANEIEVDGTYIFLYGIYVNPETELGLEAKKFLENVVKNQVVRCSIVAYTFQDIATGMCYVGGENINRMLVTHKFSKNVAL